MNKYWDITFGRTPPLSDARKAICISVLVPEFLDDYHSNVKIFEQALKPVRDRLKKLGYRIGRPSFLALLSGAAFCPSENTSLDSQVLRLIDAIPDHCFTATFVDHIRDATRKEFDNFMSNAEEADELYQVLEKLINHARAWPILLSDACMYALLAPWEDLQVYARPNMTEMDHANHQDQPDHLSKSDDDMTDFFMYMLTEISYAENASYANDEIMGKFQGLTVKRYNTCSDLP